MSKKRLLTLMGSICLVLVLVTLLVGACAEPTPAPAPAPAPAPTPAPTPAPPVEVKEYKNAIHYAPLHVYVPLMEDYCNEVAEMVGGKVKFTHYPGSTLLPPFEHYEGLVAGSADLATASFYGIDKFCPLRSELPVFAAGILTPEACGRLSMDLIEQYPPYAAEFEELNWFWVNGMSPRYLNTCKECDPIYNIAELKGVKLRATAGRETDFAIAVGAEPISLPMPENYEGFRKKIIDVLIANSEVLHAFKLAEVVQYVCTCPIPGAWPAHGVAWNWDSWNGLDKDVQDAFMELLPKYRQRAWDDWLHADLVAGLDALKAEGGEVIEWTDEAVDEFFEVWSGVVMDKAVQRLNDKGLNGAEYRALVEKLVKEKYIGSPVNTLK